MATKAQLESRDASVRNASNEAEICATICHRQQQRLYRLCEWMVHDEAEARALAVSIFLQYLRNRPIAAGLTREEAEGQDALEDILARHFTQRFRSAFLQAEEPVARPLPGVVASMNADHIKAALLALRPASRLLYLLHELEGYSLETIAAWVDLETAHCARRIYSARMDLRNILVAAA